MKIPAGERRTLSLSLWLAYVTGAALFVFSHWLRMETPVGPQRFGAEHRLRIAHASLTYLLVAGFGFLAKGHILPALHRSRRRVTGVALIALVATLVGSAVVVLYTGSDGDGPSLGAWIHGLLGLALPGWILVHRKASRK